MNLISAARVLVSLWMLALGAVPAAAALPTGWSSKDVGGVAATGTATTSGSTFVVAGAGADVWGTADEFRFVYRTLTGDCELVAQVATLDNVNAWTKAGVMMRETLTAGSKHAFMLVSPGKGLSFQRRTSTGGTSAATTVAGYAPSWVKVRRAGSTFTTSTSVDGVSWKTIGSATMNMVSTIYVGLAVSSHLDGTLATATFDSVAVKAGSTATTTTSTTPTTTTTATSGTLRLLHWNTRHGGRRTDGVYDPQLLVDYMVSFKPDVISLNEIDNSTQANTIISLLEKGTGVNWEANYNGRGNMVLTKLSVTAKSSCTVNAADNRQSAHMSVVVGGRTVNVWSSHLSLDSSAERTSEVKALQACGRQWAEARIYAGDYNMQAGTTEYNTAVTGHTDAWKVAKSLGTALNYSGNCDGCTRNSRIDYVFTSTGATSLAIKSAQIFDTEEGGVMPSDHKPLLVVYTVK